MDVRELMTEWRIILLLVFLAGSAVALGPTYSQTGPQDYTINLSGLQDNKGVDFKGGTKILLTVQSNNSSRALADQIANILRVRVSEMGLSGSTINTINIADDYKVRVIVAAQNQTRVRELISQQGAFEARMPFAVPDERNISIEDTYRFERTDSGLRVGEYTESGLEYYNKTLQVGERTQLGQNSVIYTNDTAEYAYIDIVAYASKDIDDVLTTDSRVTEGGGGRAASASFPILISQESAQRMKYIAQNYERGSDPLRDINGEPAELSFYVDGSLKTSLTVAGSFQTGEPVRQPSISTSGETASEARQEMERLQAILQSGQLPAPVKVESISTLTSSLGSDFMKASILSILGSLVAVGFLVYVRYRNPKLVLPIVFTGASEVFILLGLWFSTVATLSLSAVAGIIAAVGTGVDDQIIITDEHDKDTVEDWSQRMKTAFFVIFTSAASTIGAMTPILSPRFSTIMIGAAGLGLIMYNRYSSKGNNHYLAIGAAAIGIAVFVSQLNLSAAALSEIHEFASTTIVGIMIGITVTRPAYAKVLEQIEK
jgi:preprotein translocase subunit SecD